MRNIFHTIALIMSIATTTVLADDRRFLFATFKGEQTPMTEQVYFLVSEDGRKWDALNNAEPVLVSALGEQGVRDPFLVRSPDGKKFFLLGTDLSIHRTNHDWGRAVTAGSRSILIWESTDLVNWSKPRLAAVAPDDAGCTWAPEAVYDEAAQEYFLFWASRNRRDAFAKHRIWASRTKDFVTFSTPFVYIDNPHDVIDTDIVHEGGKYYRFSKDEKFKAITLEVSDKLAGPWQEMKDFSLAKLEGVEGPQAFAFDRPSDGRPARWCLLLDHYAKGEGYRAYATTNLASGKFEPMPDMQFPFKARHGGVLAITPQEYERLKSALQGRSK